MTVKSKDRKNTIYSKYIKNITLLIKKKFERNFGKFNAIQDILSFTLFI